MTLLSSDTISTALTLPTFLAWPTEFRSFGATCLSSAATVASRSLVMSMMFVMIVVGVVQVNIAIGDTVWPQPICSVRDSMMTMRHHHHHI
jgi:hypothetical protein